MLESSFTWVQNPAANYFRETILKLPDQFQNFEPERKSGLIFHGISLAFLMALGTAIYWFASTLAQDSLFVFLMIILVAVFGAIPLLGYRAYALLNARYLLERDGLRLRWGLRIEDIPLNTVEWVRLADESGFHVTLPPFTWYGAVLGIKEVQNLGAVEFIASKADHLVLIATHQKVYAISPQDPKAFIAAFQRVLELGSLSPIPPRSAKPAAFIRQVWQNRFAKIALTFSIALTILLWVVTGFIIANHTQLPLGFTMDGQPSDLVPSEQILLIPVLGTLALITDLVTSFFFFRNEEARLVAYLLWVGAIITPCMLLFSVILHALLV
jgi:hypothetical protein